MIKENNLYWDSVCEPIKNNKQLLLDKKICCGNEDDCTNVSDRCYNPDKLVSCHAISRIDACERRHRPNSGLENNDAVKVVCKNENLSKHLCISTNSTINNPDLDNELSWIVNRPFDGTNTEFGSSCQVCICCNGQECSRIFGKKTGCTAGCPISNTTMISERCKIALNLNETSTGDIKVANCSDMFELGSCQFFNLSTSSSLRGENKELFFQPEVCDFTIKDDSGLSTSDKIALGTGLGLGVPGFALTVFGSWLAWKQYKKGVDRRKKRLSSNNQSQNQPKNIFDDNGDTKFLDSQNNSAIELDRLDAMQTQEDLQKESLIQTQIEQPSK